MCYVVARAYSLEQQNAGWAHAGLCHTFSYYCVVVWLISNMLVSINKVILFQAQLVMRSAGGQTFVCNQPTRSSQPGYPVVSISENWGVNRHTTQGTSPVSVFAT